MQVLFIFVLIILVPPHRVKPHPIKMVRFTCVGRVGLCEEWEPLCAVILCHQSLSFYWICKVSNHEVHEASLSHWKGLLTDHFQMEGGGGT